MGDGLQDRGVLIVEDESMIAMLLEDMVTELGHRVVATAATLEQAIQAVTSPEIDFAILDVNLGGTMSLPVAQMLRDRKVPFVFATGFGSLGLAPEWRQTPTLQKPFRARELDRIMHEVLGEKM